MEVKSIAIKPDLENKVQSPTNKHLILRLTVASCCYYKAGKEEKGVWGWQGGGLGLGQGSQSKRKSLISATVFYFLFFIFIYFFPKWRRLGLWAPELSFCFRWKGQVPDTPCWVTQGVLSAPGLWTSGVHSKRAAGMGALCPAPFLGAHTCASL